jgi:hypothetical protein
MGHGRFAAQRKFHRKNKYRLMGSVNRDFRTAYFTVFSPTTTSFPLNKPNLLKRYSEVASVTGNIL